jgi:hypothetical protein
MPKNDFPQPSLFDTPHHAGGKLLRLPAGIESKATFGGPGECYRYRLERIWDRSLKTIMFLMMNPSTATEHYDDATLAKVRKYATFWGYGRLLVGNTFAYRCTDQGRLLEVENPEGPDNLKYLLEMAAESDKVVLGFGRPKIKALQAQGPKIAKNFMDNGISLYALKTSPDGTPWHPLYIADVETLKFWTGMKPAPMTRGMTP